MNKLPEWWVKNWGPKPYAIADCLGAMKKIPNDSVDSIVMDPPYGIKYKTNSWKGSRDYKQEIAGDHSTETRDAAINECKRICRGAIFIFGTWKASIPEGTHTVLIWDKGMQFGMGNLKIPWKMDWEMIFIIGGDKWRGHRGSGVLIDRSLVTWATKGRAHITEKPVGLIKQLLRKVDARIVLDPFLGSGTTLVACRELQLAGLGFEIDPKYENVIGERMMEKTPNIEEFEQESV